jgi:hypothetical protein
MRVRYTSTVLRPEGATIEDEATVELQAAWAADRLGMG